MQFPSDSQLLAAVEMRHSVRRYVDRAIDADVVDCLEAEVYRINRRCGLSFKVVTDEPKSFRNIFAYGKFENVRNYIIISGPRGDLHTDLCGYEGERLVLGLQAMGLNTCWVGLSYSKNSPVFAVPDGHKIRCVIAFGYGQTPGRERKTKTLAQLSNADDASPRWFIDAMRSVQLAPTAVNQQKFYFQLHPDGTVTARRRWSPVGYTVIDLGIARCHFELAAPGRITPSRERNQR